VIRRVSLLQCSAPGSIACSVRPTSPRETSISNWVRKTNRNDVRNYWVSAPGPSLVFQENISSLWDLPRQYVIVGKIFREIIAWSHFSLYDTVFCHAPYWAGRYTPLSAYVTGKCQPNINLGNGGSSSGLPTSIVRNQCVQHFSPIASSIIHELHNTGRMSEVEQHNNRTGGAFYWDRQLLCREDTTRSQSLVPLICVGWQ
jgi:hypothetical protein